MQRAVYHLVSRDVMLAWRYSWDGAMPVLFFILVMLLMPLGVGSDSFLLSRLAGGLCWVTALLASLLSFERLFHNDYEDGSLDQFLLSPVPLELAALAKACAHWLTNLLPLLIAVPFIASAFELEKHATQTLLLSLLIGTPILSLLGTVGAALTLGARRGSLLLCLLILPLYIPVLIIGSGAVSLVQAGFPAERNFLLLSAFLILALTFTPFVTAALLRQASEV